jgi:hypothetical protein
MFEIFTNMLLYTFLFAHFLSRRTVKYFGKLHQIKNIRKLDLKKFFEVLKNLKGTLSRDFWPPFFFIIKQLLFKIKSNIL